MGREDKIMDWMRARIKNNLFINYRIHEIEIHTGDN